MDAKGSEADGVRTGIQTSSPRPPDAPPPPPTPQPQTPSPLIPLTSQPQPQSVQLPSAFLQVPLSQTAQKETASQKTPDRTSQQGILEPPTPTTPVVLPSEILGSSDGSLQVQVTQAEAALLAQAAQVLATEVQAARSRIPHAQNPASDSAKGQAPQAPGSAAPNAQAQAQAQAQGSTPTLLPRLPGRHLRQAEIIVPSTGQRVRRDFTLRDPALYPRPSVSNGPTNERTPLLPTKNSPPQQPPTRFQACASRIRDQVKDWRKQSFDFWTSDTGHKVLKCSLAYFIATLATFALPIADLLTSHQDGNQLVANVVVWFDPARSAGSMELAILLGFVAFVYGIIVCFSSMGVTVFLAAQDMLTVAHAIVVIFFIGGSLGLMAWVKQYLGHPLVNTASAVASLAIVAVLTKEGAIQAGGVSAHRIVQILKMLVVGMAISILVNLIVWPISARKQLRESLTKSTNAFGDVLANLVGCFLSGLEQDMTHPVVVAADDRFKSVFSNLPSYLAEARYEYYFMGAEKRYAIEKRLVKCMQQLAQDIGGLRSSAATQFSLLSKKDSTSEATPLNAQYKFDDRTRNLDYIMKDTSFDTSTLMLASIEEVSEPSSIDPDEAAERVIKGARTSAQIFETFIADLGPPMKSLAYTLREILNNLPYDPTSNQEHHMFRSSLADAVKLFNTSRKEALELVYKSKDLSESSDVLVAADFEEVAASCGHFSSSLQDFAETVLKYLDILDELDLQYEERHMGRSWKWLLFWRKAPLDDDEGVPTNNRDVGNAENTLTRTISKPSALAKPPVASKDTPAATTSYLSALSGYPYKLYPYMRFLRREDTRFAIKVGIGAALYGMFAYIPQTVDFYNHWRLEWGLAAYMLVCSMTIGASNTTGWSRFHGTLTGGGLATIVWLVSGENPYVLAAFGWLISLVAYYFIEAKNQASLGRFILLTYNLSILSTYSVVSVGGNWDEVHDIEPLILSVVFHRVVSILGGILTGLIVTRLIWPIKARKKLKHGVSLLWLRMGMIWKRGPLSILIDESPNQPSYMDISEETKLREFVDNLDTVRKNAESEFKLQGPFPTESFDTLLKSTSKMLDGFHALNVVIAKDKKATPGETEILRYTADERDQMSKRLSHLLSVLASSLEMEYPITDALPDIEHTRERLLARIFEFRKKPDKKIVPTDEDYELLYAYALVTAQIAKEIEVCRKEIEKVFGVLGEDVLTLQ